MGFAEVSGRGMVGGSDGSWGLSSEVIGFEKVAANVSILAAGVLIPSHRRHCDGIHLIEETNTLQSLTKASRPPEKDLTLTTALKLAN